MALTTARTGLTPQQWDDKFFMEYVRENRFKRYMGTDENSIIQLKEDLTKKKGRQSHLRCRQQTDWRRCHWKHHPRRQRGRTRHPLYGCDRGALRHAVAVTNWDEQKSTIELRDTAKMALKMWSMEKMKTAIITALGSINGVAYADASEAQRMLGWLTTRTVFCSAQRSPTLHPTITAHRLPTSTTPATS